MRDSYFSKELAFIFKVSQIALDSDNQQLDWSVFPDLDLKKIRELINAHGIRIQFYEGLRKISLINNPELSELCDLLKTFVFNQNLLELNLRAESFKLLKLLKDHEIEAIIWKGIRIEETFYKQKNKIRECGDIDLMVKKTDFEKSLNVLFAKEYIGFNNAGEKIANQDAQRINFGNNIEITLQKESNDAITIDLHRKTYPLFTPISVSEKFIFNNDIEEHKNYFRDCVLMLIHHGGRESWLSIKNITDWYMAIKNAPESFNWSAYENELKKMGLYRAFCTGNHLVGLAFESNHLSQDQLGNIKNTIQFWDEPFSRHNPELPLNKKIKLIKLNFQILDNISFLEYIWRYVEFYSTANDLEITPGSVSTCRKTNYFNLFYKMLSKFIH